MDLTDFLSSEALRNLTPEKQLFLSQFINKSQNKSKDDMLPFMLAAIKGAQKKGLNFSKTESQILIQVLKQTMTPDEQKNLDQMMMFMETHESSDK